MRLIFNLLMLITASTMMAADYNILDFGAKADTTVLSTEALQQAIDECSRRGGGRVVVPSGIYKIGTIELRSNVHLHLELGATLYGSTDLKDYRAMKTDYVSLRTKVPTIQLIYADKVNNVTIDGIRLNNIQIRNAGNMGCSISGLPGHPVENVWLSDISIHHKGGIAASDLQKTEEAVKDEKEKEYPEATM